MRHEETKRIARQAIVACAIHRSFQGCAPTRKAELRQRALFIIGKDLADYYQKAHDAF